MNRKSSTIQLFTLLALQLNAPVSNSYLLDNQCIGYTETFGEEMPQVTDDIVSAVQFMNLID